MPLHNKHTLLDIEYFELARSIDEFASEKEIPYAVVGGCAVQAHLADIMTTPNPIFGGNKSLRDARLELNHMFRPTDDIDAVMLTDEKGGVIAHNLIQHIQERSPSDIYCDDTSIILTKNGHRLRIQLATKAHEYCGCLLYTSDAADE